MLRIFIADDSLGFGTLASAWLESFDDLEVVEAVRTAAAAIDRVVDARPDVVILDRLLPQPENSAAVLAHVRAHLPGAAVLLVSGMPDVHLSKAANADGLAAAVRAAAAAHAVGR